MGHVDRHTLLVGGFLEGRAARPADRLRRRAGDRRRSETQHGEDADQETSVFHCLYVSATLINVFCAESHDRDYIARDETLVNSPSS